MVYEMKLLAECIFPLSLWVANVLHSIIYWAGRTFICKAYSSVIMGTSHLRHC